MWKYDKKDIYHNTGEPIVETFLEAGKELGYDIGDIKGEFQDSGFSQS